MGKGRDMTRWISDYTDSSGTVYVRTRRDVAARRLNKDKTLRFFLVGCDVRPFHFFGGWGLACGPDTLSDIESREGTLDLLYNNINHYLDRELGRYPVFYVEERG
jgi:hypothetical protein